MVVEEQQDVEAGAGTLETRREAEEGLSSGASPRIAWDSPDRAANRSVTGRGHRRRSRSLFWLLAVLVLGSAGTIWWWRSEQEPKLNYTTARVDEGPISRAVTATGTVNPVLTVVVGSYVSGVIRDIYCDYNTRVRKGQICARIDPRPYELTAEQARAALDVAKAQLRKDEANLQYARVSFGRQSRLLALQATSQDAADTARSALGQDEAQILLDKASVEERQAALDAARVNLGYTDISSPVDGTVVSRNVTIGQTVAASFQTPTLFLIAQDLKKMQVDTNVSESDIESETHGISPGDRVQFTVESFPTSAFHGVVSQVRQAPQTVQNVVTYDVVVAVNNQDLKLRPGMTATVRIITQERPNVLRVPNAAVRYNPGGLSAVKQRGLSGQGRPSRVWIVRNRKPAPISIRSGLSDDMYTEIVAGNLKAGDQIITGEVGPKAEANPSHSSARAQPRM